MNDVFDECDNELLAHIFSFLGGGDRILVTGTTLGSDPHHLRPLASHREGGREREGSLPVFSSLAGQLYRQLAYVCKRWHNLCETKMAAITGLVTVRMSALWDSTWDHSQTPPIEWISKHRLRIGFLDILIEGEHCNAAVPQIVQLLEACDTIECTRIVRAHIKWQHRSLKPQMQKALHDAIAQHCPNVAQLSLNVVQPIQQSEDPNYISQTLFSLANLQELDFSLQLYKPPQASASEKFQPRFLTGLLGNLSGLKRLKLRGGSKLDHGDDWFEALDLMQNEPAVQLQLPNNLQEDFAQLNGNLNDHTHHGQLAQAAVAAAVAHGPRGGNNRRADRPINARQLAGGQFNRQRPIDLFDVDASDDDEDGIPPPPLEGEAEDDDSESGLRLPPLDDFSEADVETGEDDDDEVFELLLEYTFDINALMDTNKPRFIIESTSLLELDVSELETGNWVRCKCPALERFVCRNDNGSVPMLLRAQLNAEWLENHGFLQSFGARDLGLHAFAHQLPFIGLDMPPSCVVVSKTFRRMARVSFDDFTRLRRFIADERYWNVEA